MSDLLTLSNGATVAVYPTGQTATKYLVYFHGGGFVYGSKNDLPTKLTDVFHQAGYTVLAMDYLLAPNHSLQAILTNLEESFQELKETYIKDAPFSFCGRSAGGYATLFLTKRLIEKQATLPENLINFYGYYDLDFIDNKRIIASQTVTKELIETIDQTTPVWDDPLIQRYLLYVYGVQQQLLPDYYQVTAETSAAFTITPELFKQFPRTFSSASTSDGEVPFKYSKSLKRFIPECKFAAVYDLDHDFLKQPENEQVQKVFSQLSDWLQA